MVYKTGMRPIKSDVVLVLQFVVSVCHAHLRPHSITLSRSQTYVCVSQAGRMPAVNPSATRFELCRHVEID